jgi:hypothetical protein
MIYGIGGKTGRFRRLGKHQQKQGVFVLDVVKPIEKKQVISSCTQITVGIFGLFS